MKIYEFGNPQAEIVVIQMIGDHDLEYLEKIYEGIKENTGKDIGMICAKVEDWNRDLSPWEAPAVFGNENFKGQAQKTLEELKDLWVDPGKKYYIGGYSLGALFALWAAYQLDVFEGVASASPSIWFPGFVDYMKSHKIKSRRVYLSLGDREERTKNPTLRTVGDCIKAAYECLKEQNVEAFLEWNKGTHFNDPDKRVIAGFVKVIR